MRPTLILLILLLLFGCAVRKRETKLETGSAPGVELPDGLSVSAKHSFLVKANPTALKPGEENTLTFTVVDTDFEPVELKKAKIEVKYFMPSMPQMGVFAASAEKVEENEFDATLDIVHGGDWRVTVSITLEGRTEAEDVTFDFEVR